MKSYPGCLFSVPITDSVVVLFVQQKHEKASCGCTQGAREGISNISNMCKISRKRMPNSLVPLRSRREMKQMLITPLRDWIRGRGTILWAHTETQAGKAPLEPFSTCATSKEYFPLLLLLSLEEELLSWVFHDKDISFTEICEDAIF